MAEIVLEVHNVHAARLAHRTTKDGNNRIPAGTTVFGDHWSISRNPDVFPEPHLFKPQRWINDQGRIRDDLKFFVFGFGPYDLVNSLRTGKEMTSFHAHDLSSSPHLLQIGVHKLAL
ncbi:cytochrome P450 [Suillus clintonianus]|uniref:cytochrome P450 n=1 Tax=Suillus clintonianus TaxID=1904413 RepID=UPI001B85C887|nr:cytochrome P450 [Suillus clintonianus]KAG2121935.1 cytochrome P450 [Suillus clintonianus]